MKRRTQWSGYEDGTMSEAQPFHVALVYMPWDHVLLPSIQLGVLKPIVEAAGHTVSVRQFNLSLVEYLRRTGPRVGSKIRVGDVIRIAEEYDWFGLGDWIFAVPPYRDNTPERDAAYFAYLRGHGVPESDIELAVAMRHLASGFIDACLDDLLAERPQVVGFSVTFRQTVPSLLLARRLKATNPTIVVVFGGGKCDGPMGAALHRHFPCVDVVVRGEGEKALPALLDDLRSGTPIRPQPGLCYRDVTGEQVVVEMAGRQVAMEDVPTPNYEEYFARLREADWYSEESVRVQLKYESSRGCWWGQKTPCRFCGERDMRYSSRSPDRVYRDIVALVRRYQVLDVSLVDNIIDRSFFSEVLPRLRDSELDVSLSMEVKANLKKADIKILRECRVRAIQPGIESLSTAVLKLMRKGVTALQNIRLLKWCAEYNVQVAWNLMYGIPGEPIGEYARMAAVTRDLTHLMPPRLVRLRMHRFSEYQQNPEAYGLWRVRAAEYCRHILECEVEAHEEMSYFFDYDYVDGRDPESYVSDLREAISAWKGAIMRDYRSLRYRRGPGFIIILDERTSTGQAEYYLNDLESAIYLACDEGHTAAGVQKLLQRGLAAPLALETVKDILEEFVRVRLVYHEKGTYLSLAVRERI